MNTSKFLGLFILLNGFVLTILAQSDTIETISEEEENLCFFEKTNQTAQNTFPFNQADKIVVISFPSSYVLKNVLHKDYLKERALLETQGFSLAYDVFVRDRSLDSTLIPIKINNIIKEEKGKITEIYAKIAEQIVLNQTQIDSLFSILYYQKIKNDIGVRKLTLCYNPHHSIIFYRNSQIIAYIEICFNCENWEKAPNKRKFKLDYFCSEKWCMLQKFFYSIGIRQELLLDRCK